MATEPRHLASREIDDLYRAHVGDIYRYALAVLGNHADAEDVTQTTFLNAYRALEQGVRPRKPSNWLLTIASNAIKQRFRQEQARPRQVQLDERVADAGNGDEREGPTVGELLTALSKIPPQQRQAIVLREFEGRSYAEIAEILGITTSALETLLFRARRSLAEELQHQLTCTEAQLAISRSVDGRLGRKERRRLRDHLTDCPDCAGFAQMQRRHRSALRGLALVPIPLSLTVFRGFEGTASAALLPVAGGTAVAGGTVAAGAVGVGSTAAGSAGGILAGGAGLKAAAVVAAASVAGGVGVAGSTEVDRAPPKAKSLEQPGQRLGQVAPRGVLVPGKGIAVGKQKAPGRTQAAKPKQPGPSARSADARANGAAKATTGRSSDAAKRGAPETRRSGASGTARARAGVAKTKPVARPRAEKTAPPRGARARGASAAPQKPAPTAQPAPEAADRGNASESAGGPKG